jgi:hypothetical protein
MAALSRLINSGQFANPTQSDAAKQPELVVDGAGNQAIRFGFGDSMDFSPGTVDGHYLGLATSIGSVLLRVNGSSDGRWHLFGFEKSGRSVYAGDQYLAICHKVGAPGAINPGEFLPLAQARGAQTGFPNHDDEGNEVGGSGNSGLFYEHDEILEVVELDFENSEKVTNMFSRCRNLTRVRPQIRVKNCSTLWTFQWCDKLATVDQKVLIAPGSCIVGLFRGTAITSLPDGEWHNASDLSHVFANCPNLTHVPAGVFDASVSSKYDNVFWQSALNQASVDNVLQSVWNSAQASNIRDGVLGLHDGSNAAPSSSGLAAKNNLVSYGWTVNTN